MLTYQFLKGNSYEKHQHRKTSRNERIVLEE